MVSPKLNRFCAVFLVLCAVVGILLTALLIRSESIGNRRKTVLPPSHDDNLSRRVLVYRGPVGSEAYFRGIPSSTARLIELSSYGFMVEFVGPNETRDINDETLKVEEIAMLVFPGGGDLNQAWNIVGKYSDSVRKYVFNGGRYVGICLGAYLAGSDPGFSLLPQGSDTDQYITSPGAAVKDEKSYVVQVDWKHGRPSEEANGGRGRWLFFQDGAVMTLDSSASKVATILGTYSSNGRIAAMMMPVGKGRIGLVGPHPEADDTWYARKKDPKNPEGVQRDIGIDFIEAVFSGK